MAITIQTRRDTEANWIANNPILSSGEIAFSTDKYKIKIGNGTSNWLSLSYMNDIAGASIDSSSTTISTNTATTINTLDASIYRSAEYLVQVVQGSKQTVSKIIMVHNGTTANISEYGVIELGGTRIPLTISATLSGSNVLLQATISDASTTNASVDVLRTAIML